MEAYKYSISLNKMQKIDWDKIDQLEAENHDLQATKNTLDRVTRYKEKLSSLKPSELTSAQKLWLFAHAAAEEKLESQLKTPEGKNIVAENLFLLDATIPKF
jgi:hypothetical protein